MSAVRGIYDTQLGLSVTSSGVALPNCPIEIVPAADNDEGLVGVQLRAENVDATREWFGRIGRGLDDRSSVPVERSLGARLEIVA